MALATDLTFQKNLFYLLQRKPLKNEVNFKIYDVTSRLTNNYNIHIALYLTK